ncbi:hypothetical protein ACC771_13230, partial [Rhizobium ruizarguesonis]
VAFVTSPGAFTQAWLKRHQPDDVQYDLEYPLAHRYLSFAIICRLLPGAFKRAYRRPRMT